jgi:hypothetical protein
MNSTPHGWAILALLLTSVLVRVVPSFVRLSLSDSGRTLLERVLPMAVFLNFAVYIATVEIKHAPLPAAAAFVLCALVTFSTKVGLIFNTVAGVMLWYFVLRLMPG